MATATRKKPDNDSTMVCTMAHATERDVFPLEMEVRGNHPDVKANPQFWAPFGTPRSEWPSPHDRVVDEGDREEAMEARINVVELVAPPQPTVLRCVKSYVTTIDGIPATIKANSTILSTDPRAAERPDAWEPADAQALERVKTDGLSLRNLRFSR